MISQGLNSFRKTQSNKCISEATTLVTGGNLGKTHKGRQTQQFLSFE